MLIYPANVPTINWLVSDRIVILIFVGFFLTTFLKVTNTIIIKTNALIN